MKLLPSARLSDQVTIEVIGQCPSVPCLCNRVMSSVDKLECSEYTPEDSLYIARILGEIQRQIGVTFDI